jgi:histidinol phosphatase-like PHP family hydrolase
MKCVVTDEELKALVASLAVAQKATDEQLKETDRQLQETGRKLNKVAKMIGGISAEMLSGRKIGSTFRFCDGCIVSVHEFTEKNGSYFRRIIKRDSFVELY